MLSKTFTVPISKCCLLNCPISRYGGIKRLDNLDNTSTIPTASTCPGSSNWDTWNTANITNDSLGKPRHLCMFRSEIGGSPLVFVGILAVLCFGNVQFPEEEIITQRERYRKEVRQHYPFKEKNDTGTDDINQRPSFKQTILRYVDRALKHKTETSETNDDQAAMKYKTETSETNVDQAMKYKTEMFGIKTENFMKIFVGSLIGVVGSLGLIIDFIMNVTRPLTEDFLHLSFGICGNICVGIYVYNNVYYRIIKTYYKVFLDVKEFSELVKNKDFEGKNENSDVGEKTKEKNEKKSLFDKSLVNLPDSIKTVRNLKGWMAARQLLLENLEPEYLYASTSLTIIVISCLYFISFMAIRTVIEYYADGHTPFVILASNAQNFSATFGLASVFLVWSFSVLWQIVEIGKEQEEHSNILEKALFSLKLTTEASEELNNIEMFVNSCREHIEAHDNYPKAIMSLEIRPHLVYGLFVYFGSSIATFIIVQVYSINNSDVSETAASLSRGGNIILALSIALGLPFVYTIVHSFHACQWRQDFNIEYEKNK